MTDLDRRNEFWEMAFRCVCGPVPQGEINAVLNRTGATEDELDYASEVYREIVTRYGWDGVADPDW